MLMSNYPGNNSFSFKSIKKVKSAKVYKEITETPEQAFVVERVLDWNARIEGYTQAQKNKYKVALEKTEMFLNILKEDSKGWS